MTAPSQPELPPPSIRVTHEDDKVYCVDVPADQVPPHDNFWSEAKILAWGQQCYEAGRAAGVKAVHDALDEDAASIRKG